MKIVTLIVSLIFVLSLVPFVSAIGATPMPDYKFPDIGSIILNITNNCTVPDACDNVTMNITNNITNNIFDQSLNTADDVQFNSVTATNICYSDGSQCNVTNESYYTIDNPFGFFNLTNLQSITNIFDQWLNTTDNVQFNNATSSAFNSTDDIWCNQSLCYSIASFLDTYNETYETGFQYATNGTYYTVDNPFNFWNSTFALFNKTYADTLYYDLGNSFGFWNDTYALFNKTYADTLYYDLANSFSFYNSTNPQPMTNIFDQDLNTTSIVVFGNITSSAFNSTADSFCNATSCYPLSALLGGGGGAYDQDLNTTSDVEFNTVNATNICYSNSSQCNITNTSYYLESNPYNYYNSTNPSPETNWDANYSDYLNTKNYALNDSKWTSNYSDYLNTKNYALNDSRWTSNYSDYLNTKNYALNDSRWTSNYSDYLITNNYALNETKWTGNQSNYPNLTDLDNDTIIRTYNDSWIVTNVGNYSAENSTIGRIGDCPEYQLVQNLTTGGVQCSDAYQNITNNITTYINTTVLNNITTTINDTLWNESAYKLYPANSSDSVYANNLCYSNGTNCTMINSSYARMNYTNTGNFVVNSSQIYEDDVKVLTINNDVVGGQSTIDFVDLGTEYYRIRHPVGSSLFFESLFNAGTIAFKSAAYNNLYMTGNSTAFGAIADSNQPQTVFINGSLNISDGAVISGNITNTSCIELNGTYACDWSEINLTSTDYINKSGDVVTPLSTWNYEQGDLLNVSVIQPNYITLPSSTVSTSGYYNVSGLFFSYSGFDYPSPLSGGVSRMCNDNYNMINDCILLLAFVGGNNFTTINPSNENGTNNYSLCLYSNPANGNNFSLIMRQDHMNNDSDCQNIINNWIKYVPDIVLYQPEILYTDTSTVHNNYTLNMTSGLTLSPSYADPDGYMNWTVSTSTTPSALGIVGGSTNIANIDINSITAFNKFAIWRDNILGEYQLFRYNITSPNSEIGHIIASGGGADGIPVNNYAMISMEAVNSTVGIETGDIILRTAYDGDMKDSIRLDYIGGNINNIQLGDGNSTWISTGIDPSQYSQFIIQPAINYGTGYSQPLHILGGDSSYGNDDAANTYIVAGKSSGSGSSGYYYTASNQYVNYSGNIYNFMSMDITLLAPDYIFGGNTQPCSVLGTETALTTPVCTFINGTDNLSLALLDLSPIDPSIGNATMIVNTTFVDCSDVDAWSGGIVNCYYACQLYEANGYGNNYTLNESCYNATINVTSGLIYPPYINYTYVTTNPPSNGTLYLGYNAEAFNGYIPEYTTPVVIGNNTANFSDSEINFNKIINNVYAWNATIGQIWDGEPTQSLLMQFNPNLTLITSPASFTYGVQINDNLTVSNIFDWGNLELGGNINNTADYLCVINGTSGSNQFCLSDERNGWSYLNSVSQAIFGNGDDDNMITNSQITDSNQGTFGIVGQTPISNDGTGYNGTDIIIASGSGAVALNNNFYISLSPREYNGIEYNDTISISHNGLESITQDNYSLGLNGNDNISLCLIDNSGTTLTVLYENNISITGLNCSGLVNLLSGGDPSVILMYEEPNVFISHGSTDNFTDNFNASTSVVSGYTDPPYLYYNDSSTIIPSGNSGSVYLVGNSGGSGLINGNDGRVYLGYSELSHFTGEPWGTDERYSDVDLMNGQVIFYPNSSAFISDDYNISFDLLNLNGNINTGNVTAENLCYSNGSNCNVTNESYYTIDNPFGFWNSTFALFNKTYADTLYAPLSEPKWSANYSDYLNTKNYALNDSKWTGNFTLYNTSWSNTTNSSYHIGYKYATNNTFVRNTGATTNVNLGNYNLTVRAINMTLGSLKGNYDWIYVPVTVNGTIACSRLSSKIAGWTYACQTCANATNGAAIACTTNAVYAENCACKVTG